MRAHGLRPSGRQAGPLSCTSASHQAPKDPLSIVIPSEARNLALPLETFRARFLASLGMTWLVGFFTPSEAWDAVRRYDSEHRMGRQTSCGSLCRPSGAKVTLGCCSIPRLALWATIWRPSGPVQAGRSDLRYNRSWLSADAHGAATSAAPTRSGLRSGLRAWGRLVCRVRGRGRGPGLPPRICRRSGLGALLAWRGRRLRWNWRSLRLWLSWRSTRRLGLRGRRRRCLLRGLRLWAPWLPRTRS